MKNTIIITGVTSGFGESMVKTLLDEGFTIIGTVRNLNERKDLFTNLLKEFENKLFLYDLDISKQDSCDQFIAEVNKNHSDSIKALINNAGLGSFGPLEHFRDEQIRYQMEVNFFGPVKLIRGFLPSLRKNEGKIINITSIMGQFSYPLGALYSASKFALEGLTEGLRYELSPHGIQVCSILPGGHKTKFMKNVLWAPEDSSENPIYKKQYKSYKEFTQKLQSSGKAPGPKKIGSEVLKILKSNSNPRSVHLGLDAKMLNITKKLLPERIYQYLLNTIFKKKFS